MFSISDYVSRIDFIVLIVCWKVAFLAWVYCPKPRDILIILIPGSILTILIVKDKF